MLQPESRIPYETVKAIAQDAQDAVDKQIVTIKT
jgi:hypothetical protein